MFRTTFLAGICFLLFFGTGFSQNDTIKLTNPSFEGQPFEGGGTINFRLPKGWIDCGFRGESPPDVHPVPNGQFEVSKPAHEGRTYIGMVTRDNETWEKIGQKLSRPIQKGKCYEFSMYIARSELYRSAGRTAQTAKIKQNYVEPIKLRIYGGNEYCGKAELLGETSLIRNARWLEYNFRFEPLESFQYLVFEAYYKTPSLFPYNGNILIDNASHIVGVPCDDELQIASNEPDEPKLNTSPSKADDSASSSGITPAQPTPAPKITEGLDAATVRAGQTIRIEKLYFKADSTAMTYESYDALEELFEFMRNNPGIVIEIGGHTNTIPPHNYCDKLSTLRAKAVADFLSIRGIAESRLKYKGYGKRKPLTLSTSQEGRKKNQRVELKILSVNG